MKGQSSPKRRWCPILKLPQQGLCPPIEGELDLSDEIWDFEFDSGSSELSFSRLIKGKAQPEKEVLPAT
jgi:hypothetical protein